MTVGYKIKKLREQKKISQSEMAHLLGVSQTALSHIENGLTKKLDFKFMDKVCREFEVSFDYFIDDKQVNKVKENEGGVVGTNNGTINNFPENLVDQLKLLIDDNKEKEARIKELESNQK
ncbi:helix-turn-helix domain-containing protein [Flavobacterium sp. XS1P32]|uniref:helix-turn-helix domain-containing protein n=1 Tax=Flavobacterium sp. XS1P32 TaxID=3401726 RepID=UPI003AAA4B42